MLRMTVDLIYRSSKIPVPYETKACFFKTQASSLQRFPLMDLQCSKDSCHIVNVLESLQHLSICTCISQQLLCPSQFCIFGFINGSLFELFQQSIFVCQLILVFSCLCSTSLSGCFLSQDGSCNIGGLFGFRFWQFLLRFLLSLKVFLPLFFPRFVSDKSCL